MVCRTRRPAALSAAALWNCLRGRDETCGFVPANVPAPLAVRQGTGLEDAKETWLRREYQPAFRVDCGCC